MTEQGSTSELHRAAIGIACELSIGEGDLRVIDGLVEDLPDELRTAHRLLALVSVYADGVRRSGPGSLVAAGLEVALRGNP